MKIITICGSLRFQNEMQRIALDLEFSGNCVLVPIYPLKPKIGSEEHYEPEQLRALADAHDKRIEISDAIYVVNPGGYIGDAVNHEIEFAKSLNKEIIYLEKPNQ